MRITQRDLAARICGVRRQIGAPWFEFTRYRGCFSLARRPKAVSSKNDPNRTGVVLCGSGSARMTQVRKSPTCRQGLQDGVSGSIDRGRETLNRGAVVGKSDLPRIGAAEPLRWPSTARTDTAQTSKASTM